MAKIAATTPEMFKGPVYVTETEYEIWYSRPLSLGRIVKKGNRWFTEDGSRFISSRDATDYLARLYETTHGLTPSEPVGRTMKEMERLEKLRTDKKVKEKEHLLTKRKVSNRKLTTENAVAKLEELSKATPELKVLLTELLNKLQ